MHKVRKELYFADDGTPFEENREACEAYDIVYHKVYKMIWYGRVLFWNYKNEFFNAKLLNYKWNKDDKLCYYEWVKKQLKNIACVRIVVDKNEPEFEEVWGLLMGLLNVKHSNVNQLYANYETGDLMMYEPYLQRYVNQSDIIRNTTRIEKELDAAIPEEVKKFMEGLCK